MSVQLNSNLAARDVAQTEAVNANNIPFRANRDNSLERNPEQDSYDKKKSSTGKKIGIAASIIAIAALIVGGICYKKGGTEGVEKKFFERIKDGWKDLFHFKKKGEDLNLDEIINNSGNPTEVEVVDLGLTEVGT